MNNVNDSTSYDETLTKRTRDISGLQKAAILFNFLGNDAVKPILTHLSRDEVELITDYMKSAKSLSKEDAQFVVSDFEKATSTLVSIDDPSQLAVSVLNEYDEVQIKISPEAQRKSAFKYIYSLDTKPASELYDLLVDEPESVWACILSQISTVKGGELLSLVEKEKRFKIIYSLSILKNVNENTLINLNALLEKKFDQQESAPQFNGPKKSADILSLCDEVESLDLLSQMQNIDNDLHDQITAHYMSFADLINLNEKTLQKILTTLQPQEIAQAICQSDHDIKTKCLGVITKRSAMLIEEEIKSMQDLHQKVIQQAQQKIIAQARKLESNNEIDLSVNND